MLANADANSWYTHADAYPDDTNTDTNAWDTDTNTYADDTDSDANGDGNTYT
jgi:hypothetical protein